MKPIDEVQALFNSAQTATQWRTVISRAYYSSFRRLVEVASKLGFDQNAQDATVPKRSVHRRLFDFLRGSNLPVLKKIGSHVIEPLWQMRVKADYRFGTAVTRPEAEEALLMALDVEDWITDAGLT